MLATTLSQSKKSEVDHHSNCILGHDQGRLIFAKQNQ